MQAFELQEKIAEFWQSDCSFAKSGLGQCLQRYAVIRYDPNIYAQAFEILKRVIASGECSHDELDTITRGVVNYIDVLAQARLLCAVVNARKYCKITLY